MKTKHVLLALLVAILIVGCCMPTPTPPSADVIHRESIELVGYTPQTREERARFEAILNEYQTKDPAIFKVSRFDGAFDPAKNWGRMEDVGCELLGMIAFWKDGSKNGGRMTHTTGITDYAGRIGMTCSTSCGGHGTNNADMVRRVNEVIGKSHRKHHPH